MGNVSNELPCEVLKGMQDSLSDVKAQLREVRDEIRTMRTHMLAFQTDINNLYNGQAEMSLRLERVERRLNLTEERQ
jgi:chromosome segregation ATPase